MSIETTLSMLGGIFAVVAFVSATLALRRASAAPVPVRVSDRTDARNHAPRRD